MTNTSEKYERTQQGNLLNEYTGIKYQDVMLEFRILWRKIAPNPIKSGVDTGENNVALKKVRQL